MPCSRRSCVTISTTPLSRARLMMLSESGLSSSFGTAEMMSMRMARNRQRSWHYHARRAVHKLFHSSLQKDLNMLFRRCCLALLFTCYAALANAQMLETKNKFVAGDVEAETGILSIKTVVNGKSRDYLTNPGHSYLSLSINGRWYTNNNVGGQNLVGNLGGGGSSVTPTMLDNGRTSLIQDTIQTIFDEAGGAYSIIQEVYPVAFRASGQIVLRVKILNRSNVPLSVEGLQWMNDLQGGTNDNPFLIERNYYDGNHWRVASKD